MLTIMMLAGVIGAVVGSFVATLVLRWERGEGIGGRSHCDHCKGPLRAVDLVPLLSIIWLRGRCRMCGGVIDRFHFGVETGAVLIGVAALAVLPGLSGWLLALFGWMLLPLALLDARHHWLPDALIAPLAVAGILLAGPMLDVSVADRLIGAVVGGATLAALAWLFVRVRGHDGMGSGDPKLVAAVGAWLGWAALPGMILLASASGIIWAVLTPKRDAALTPRRVPFGVFIALASWASVLAAWASVPMFRLF